MDAIKEYFRIADKLEHEEITLQEYEEQCQMLRDVREVVHGEWQVYYDEDSPQDGIWKCSVCNCVRLIDDISPTNFCPNCGAKMDERRRDG